MNPQPTSSQAVTRAATINGALAVSMFVIMVACIIYFLYDPHRDGPGGLNGKAPKLFAQLAHVQTVSESRARDLKAARVRGAKENYEQVRDYAEQCIGYLKGAILAGQGEEANLRAWLANLTKAADQFAAWADGQLPRHGGKSAATADDQSNCLSAVLRAIAERDQQRRKVLADALEQYRLRPWTDLGTETGLGK
jgi:hypothetical protein